jgi:hypothetical protein
MRKNFCDCCEKELTLEEHIEIECFHKEERKLLKIFKYDKFGDKLMLEICNDCFNKILNFVNKNHSKDTPNGR